MSQALAQSATALTPSQEQFCLEDCIKRNSVKAIKNANSVATKERLVLNFNKLTNACRDEWKASHGQVNRVPDEVDKVIQAGVQEYIGSHVNRINASNSRTLNIRDVHDRKNLAIVEKVTVIGENILILQAQLEGCNRLIRANKDKIETYEKQDANGNSTKDYAELLKSARAERDALQRTKHHIQATIEENSKVNIKP